MPALHIDTDMGVDDALALVVAARLPDVRIVGVSTVFGNVPLDLATRNARIFRQWLSPRLDVPLLVGASHPMRGRPKDATAIHGEDGLGGTTVQLDEEFLSRVCHPDEGEYRLTDYQASGEYRQADGNELVTIVGIGPATNLPSLIALYGPALSRIVLMTGVVFDVGNITDAAEFNAWSDPAALIDTLATGVPITIVPLDVCRKVQLSRETIVGWRSREQTPLMRLLSDAHLHYVKSYRASEGIDGCFPHDTLAVLAAAYPERFVHLDGEVTVETSGAARGRTRFVRTESGRTRVVMGGRLAWVREGLRDLFSAETRSENGSLP